MTTIATQQPRCHKCGSANVAATSSTQYRVIDGKRRRVAEAVCMNTKCGNSWWSVNPAVLKMAKQADDARTNG